MLSPRLAGERAYYSGHDRDLAAEITKRLAPKAEFISEMMSDFPIYARRMDLSRFIVRYELFKQAMQVPGYFVEIGVYKGNGLMTWAKLIDMHCPGDRMRRVVGFDNFKGFTNLHEKDGAASEQGNKVVGGWNPGGAKEDLDFFIDVFQADRFLPRASLIEIVDGDVCATAAKWAKANPGIRIALLNLDVDLYEPTRAVLEALYPMVSPRGVVLIDEYGARDFPGPAIAVEEYLGKLPPLLKNPLFTQPGAYFLKP
jgi:hypothetical protein